MKVKLAGRLQHVVGLVIFSAVVLGLVNFTSDEPVSDQLSIATAYICVLLMAIALAIGPILAYWSGSINPINIYLRRDIGIAAALSGLAHLFLATIQSMNPKYIEKYVEATGAGFFDHVRAELFLWGSVTAFAAGILLLLLLCLSNNAALRFLGAHWWKRLQRLAYVAFGLTIAHALVFQIIEDRVLILIVFLMIVFFAVLILQTIGFARVSKKL